MLILQLTTRELSVIIRKAIHQAFAHRHSIPEDAFTFNLHISEAAEIAKIPEAELLKAVACRRVPHLQRPGGYYFNASQLKHWQQNAMLHGKVKSK